MTDPVSMTVNEPQINVNQSETIEILPDTDLSQDRLRQVTGTLLCLSLH